MKLLTLKEVDKLNTSSSGAFAIAQCEIKRVHKDQFSWILLCAPKQPCSGKQPEFWTTNIYNCITIHIQDEIFN